MNEHVPNLKMLGVVWIGGNVSKFEPGYDGIWCDRFWACKIICKKRRVFDVDVYVGSK